MTSGQTKRRFLSDSISVCPLDTVSTSIRLSDFGVFPITQRLVFEHPIFLKMPLASLYEGVSVVSSVLSSLSESLKFPNLCHQTHCRIVLNMFSRLFVSLPVAVSVSPSFRPSVLFASARLSDYLSSCPWLICLFQLVCPSLSLSLSKIIHKTFFFLQKSRCVIYWLLPWWFWLLITITLYITKGKRSSSEQETVVSSMRPCPALDNFKNV